MKLFFSVIVVLILGTLFAPRAHAIIFLPAIILIPIAKIVALIIGGFSLPAFGLGALWSKLFKKSLKRTIVVVVILLIILAAILVIFLKLYNPDRPLF